MPSEDATDCRMGTTWAYASAGVSQWSASSTAYGYFTAGWRCPSAAPEGSCARFAFLCAGGESSGAGGPSSGSGGSPAPNTWLHSSHGVQPAKLKSGCSDQTSVSAPMVPRSASSAPSSALTSSSQPS